MVVELVEQGVAVDVDAVGFGEGGGDVYLVGEVGGLGEGDC